MGKTKNEKRIVVLAILFIVAILICAGLYSYGDIDVSTFNDNWYIEDGNGGKEFISIPGAIEGKHVLEPFAIKKDISENDGAVMFVLEYASLTAKIDDKEVGEWGFDNGMFAMPGRRLITIDLDSHDGETLELELVKYTNNFLGSFYLGSTSNLVLYSVRSSLMLFILGMILVMLGLFLLIIYYLDDYKSANRKSNMFLGIFAIVVGLYLPGRTFFIYHLLSSNQIMITFMILQFLLPVSILAFALSISKKARVVIKSALILHCICYPVISLNQMLNAHANIYLLMVFQYLHLIYYILSFAAVIIEFKSKNAELKRMGFGFLLLGAGFLLDILNSNVNKEIDAHFFKTSLVIFIAIQCIDRSIQFIKHTSDMKARLTTADYKAKILMDNFEKTSEHIEEIRLLKHDMNSHINSISSLLEDGNVVKAKKYIEGMGEREVLRAPVEICCVPVIDAITNKAINESKEKDIAFDYSVNINERIEIDDMDLCSLLTNILDNAIEACGGVSGSWIKFDCHIKNNFLYISCKNSVDGRVNKKDGKYKTSKGNEKEHGYGIKIINKVAKKNKGIVNIYDQEHLFAVEIAIQLTG